MGRQEGEVSPSLDPRQGRRLHGEGVKVSGELVGGLLRFGAAFDETPAFLVERDEVRCLGGGATETFTVVDRI